MEEKSYRVEVQYGLRVGSKTEAEHFTVTVKAFDPKKAAEHTLGLHEFRSDNESDEVFEVTVTSVPLEQTEQPDQDIYGRKFPSDVARDEDIASGSSFRNTATFRTRESRAYQWGV